jgi:hypothetical protein
VNALQSDEIWHQNISSIQEYSIKVHSFFNNSALKVQVAVLLCTEPALFVDSVGRSVDCNNLPV